MQYSAQPMISAETLMAERSDLLWFPDQEGLSVIAIFFHHAWYDDEGALSWLVESVDSCDLITLVARLHLPFTFENLQFSF